MTSPVQRRADWIAANRPHAEWIAGLHGVNWQVTPRVDASPDAPDRGARCGTGPSCIAGRVRSLRTG